MMVAVKWSDYLLVKTEMKGKLARNGEKTEGRVLKLSSKLQSEKIAKR